MPISHLVHTRTGTGEPVVLLHGIGHRRQAWDPVVQMLAKEHEVIQVDLAGFGESPAYPGRVPYTMDNACRDLAQNFALWGVERPHVVGNSLGGAIALELGSRGLARSVVGLAPAGFFGRADRFTALGKLLVLKLTSYLPVAIVRPALRSGHGRRLLGRFLYEHGERISPEDFVADTLALRNGSAFFPTLLQGTRYAYAKPLDVPTTIAWGTRDRILPYSQSGRAQERLPRATHVALPGCGHVPMIDDPELVARVILDTSTI